MLWKIFRDLFSVLYCSLRLSEEILDFSAVRLYTLLMVGHEQFNTFPDALDALAAALGSRAFKPNEYHIVLTPDRYTLSVERKLFTGGGAMDLEVLTLSRLARRVEGAKKILSREGGVMLTARAVFALGKELTYYKRAAIYPDFARQVYDALGQIAASDKDPLELSEQAHGVTRQKLIDLAKIKTEYEKLKDEYLDPKDRLNELIDGCGQSELVKRTHFYAIGFSDETKLNLKVFDALSRAALSFTLFDALPPEENKTAAEVYRAPDRITQYKTVASRIREYAYKGGSYGDVSVVCPEPKTLARILREYGVEFYYDNATPLDETPPTALLSLIHRIANGDDDGERIVTLCKNPFSGVSPDDADSLQYETVKSGIEYGALGREYKNNGSRRAIARVSALVSVFKQAQTFADACEAVMDIADFENRQEELRSLSDGLSDDDLVFTDMISPIRSLIEQVRRYGNGDRASDAQSFFSAARALKVKSLPRYGDRVTVSMPETFRLERCKKLFVTDMNEGVLPAVTAEDGLLADAEIAETGGLVEPTVREINRCARTELLSVISNAVDVTCFYHTSGARRSTFLSSACGLAEEDDGDYASECAVLKKSRDVALISRFACVGNAARELAARNMTLFRDELIRAAGRGRASAPFVNRISGIKLKRLSVSELDRWFECPYKRFLTYSVGLSRRAVGFEAVDFGVVVHAFMKAFTDKYISCGMLDDSYEFAEKTVEDELNELGIELDDGSKARIIRDACDYAALNKRVIEAGSYRPIAAEREFSGDIGLGKSSVPFTGVIDRVDGCGDDLRLIDYKTYKKEFDAAECESGLDMQLPLYAAELKATTGSSVTGMFYMPLAPVYDAGETAMSGCLIKDRRVIVDYDAMLDGGQKSAVVGVSLNKNGSVSERSKKTLCTREQFDALTARCVSTASLAADEIESGYIERAPSKGACDKCGYRGLCFSKKHRGGS